MRCMISCAMESIDLLSVSIMTWAVFSYVEDRSVMSSEMRSLRVVPERSGLLEASLSRWATRVSNDALRYMQRVLS